MKYRDVKKYRVQTIIKTKQSNLPNSKFNGNLEKFELGSFIELESFREREF